MRAENELKASRKRCEALETEAAAAVELRKLLEAAKQDIAVKDALIASDMDEIKRYVVVLHLRVFYMIFQFIVARAYIESESEASNLIFP